MKITIIDYGLGNIWSVQNAFSYIGADVLVSSNPSQVASAECLVLPGVGSFGAGMNNLHHSGLVDPIRVAALERCVPILGICLGMQLFANSSQEALGVKGLGFIPGEVKKFEDQSLRLPHMGFNSAIPTRTNDSYPGILADDALDFYFVHSYYFVPKNEGHVMARTGYGEKFVSAVKNKNIYGVQFHPEKSQSNGLKLIQRFLDLNTHG